MMHDGHSFDPEPLAVILPKEVKAISGL